jgi:hypothetical protein
MAPEKTLYYIDEMRNLMNHQNLRNEMEIVLEKQARHNIMRV